MDMKASQIRCWQTVFVINGGAGARGADGLFVRRVPKSFFSKKTKKCRPHGLFASDEHVPVQIIADIPNFDLIFWRISADASVQKG